MAAPLENEGGSTAKRAIWSDVIFVIAVAFAVFHLYAGAFGLLEGIKQRVIHLGFALVLVFLSRPLFRAPGLRLIDVALAVLALVPSIYLVVEDHALDMRMGIAYDRDVILGTIMIVVLFEATRRVAGLALPIIAGLSIIYAYFGRQMPDAIAHAGFSLEDIAVTLYLTTEGIFSIPLTVSANYIVLFIILGAVLQATGAAQFFSDLAYSAFGQVRGGPAKVSVVASGLFGMISGSAVANVASTGVLTIPLMKRTGFSPRFAGAVEAVASSCGQFMPPIMASAAFVIAETLAVPYLDVAAAAAIPALLYYGALFVAVDLRAAHLGIAGQSRSDLPPLLPVLRSGIHLMLVPVTLVVMMAGFGYSPLKAAVWTIATNVVLYFVAETYLSRSPSVARRAMALLVAAHVLAFLLFQVLDALWATLLYVACVLLLLRFGQTERYPAVAFIRERALVLVDALRSGGLGAIDVAIACASAGIIIGMLMLTGLGLRISGLLVDLSGGSLPVLLALTMVASLILGMGVPTLGAYIVLAVLVAPSMVQLGVEPIAAHLFIFYFGVISAITPPVCMAAFAAAAISGAHPMRTGLTAFRLGIPVFIVPYIMIYHPAMVLEGTTLEIIRVAITGLVGAGALAAGLEGYILRQMHLIERAAAVLGGFLLIMGDAMTDALGFALLAGVLVVQTVLQRAERRSAVAIRSNDNED